jgi:transposase-like protein
MALISVLCPYCHSDQVIKGGKTKAGIQRYKCQNTDCPHYGFVASFHSCPFEVYLLSLPF